MLAARCRYGERRPQWPHQPLFVERKVHRERFSGERSHKQRAPMEQQYVQRYTGGAPEAGRGKRAPLRCRLLHCHYAAFLAPLLAKQSLLALHSLLPLLQAAPGAPQT